jgi:hypothetical protein
MKRTNSEDLESAIARVVQEHIAGLHQAAAAAVERAFSRRAPGPQVRGRVPERRASGRRRGADEVAGLAERLYTAVCANPGAAMSTLSTQVGESPRALNRPAMQLRRSGRLRTVGQRQGTRYFPMTGKGSAKS